MSDVIFLNKDGVNLGLRESNIEQYNEIVSRANKIFEIIWTYYKTNKLDHIENQIDNILSETNIRYKFKKESKSLYELVLESDDVSIIYLIKLNNSSYKINRMQVLFYDWIDSYNYVFIFDKENLTENQLNDINSKTEIYNQIVATKRMKDLILDSAALVSPDTSIRIRQLDNIIKDAEQERDNLLNEHKKNIDFDSSMRTLDTKLNELYDEFSKRRVII